MAASRKRAFASVLFITANASCAAAQTPGGPGSDNSMSFSDVMAVSFFMAIFFPVLVVLLAFACLRLFRPPPDDPPATENSWSEWPRPRHKEGLDAAEIAALPLVSYRDVKQHRASDGRIDPLECAVCLLEFDDDDSLRLLPTCPHAFHPQCIGLWLEKHVTCPLCRASVLDPPPPPAPEQELETPAPPDSPPARDHETVVLIEDDPSRNIEEEEDRTGILARTRREAGREALPRSNSTGHERCGGMERFALRLPEHVRLEILVSHRLRHVTSAVASVRVREGSAHDPAAGGNSVRSAVARLFSLFAPGDGWSRDVDDKSAGLPRRRRDDSTRGAGAGEDKRNH
ncbi:hypothetical protein ZWY2020_018164 [Hordeum vulgare]|nr:hypothetical protein ZWY2020_018164 [Hordeum vulgare]